MEEKAKPIEAVIVDIDVPWGSLIVFLIKLALAAIPAGIIIALSFAFLGAIFAGISGHK